MTEPVEAQGVLAARAPLLGCGVLSLALLAGAGWQRSANGVQAELLTLGALCAPLLIGPWVARGGLCPPRGSTYVLAALGLLAIRPLTVLAWGPCLVAAALAMWLQRLPSGLPSAARGRLAARALMLTGAGVTLWHASLGQPSGWLRLLLLLPVVWELTRKAAPPGCATVFGRGALGWSLLAAHITPSIRGSSSGALPATAMALVAALWAVSALRRRMPDVEAPAPTPRRLALNHACWILGPLALVSLRLGDPRPATPSPSMTLLALNRLVHYEQRPEAFDVVYVGDSRTLCGVHPHLLDPLLGTRSINLSMWAHWLPTQYPFFKALLERLPPGTTLVWTVGYQNLGSETGHQFVSEHFPIPLSDVPLYLRLGFSWTQLRSNLIQHSALGLPLRPLLGLASRLRAQADAFGARTWTWGDRTPAATSEGAGQGVDDSTQEAARLVERLRSQPEVLLAQPFRSGGRVTSVEVYCRQGGYQRHELDRPFFRALQREAGQAPDATGPYDPPAPGPWGLFTRILDLCAEHGVHLIVNEFQEGPHHFRQRPHALERMRAFMREVVRPAVEARGFTYVRADLEQLRPEDFFDTDHLNHQGAERYAPLLADVLRPHLRGAD